MVSGGNFGCIGASRTDQKEEVLFTVIKLRDWGLEFEVSTLGYYSSSPK